MRTAFIWAMMSLFLLASVWGASIGVSPSEVVFEGLYVDGYAAPTLQVSTMDPYVRVSVSVEPAELSWISVEPESFAVQHGRPALLTVRAEPAEVAPGNYSGSLVIHVEPSEPRLGEGTRSIVLPALRVPIRASITGEAILRCGLELTVPAVPEDGLLTLDLRLTNRGNVRLSPDVSVELGTEDTIEEHTTVNLSARPGETTERKEMVVHHLQEGNHWVLADPGPCGEAVFVPFKVSPPAGGLPTVESLEAGEGVRGQYIPMTAQLFNQNPFPVESTLVVDISSPAGEVQRVTSGPLRMASGERQNLTLHFRPLGAGSYRARAYLEMGALQSSDVGRTITVHRNATARPYIILALLGASILLLLRGIARRR